MRSGQPLSDEDRKPWLDQIARMVRQKSTRSESAVFAASLLRRAYREQIRSAGKNTHFVYLKGDAQRIRSRMEERSDHFFNPALLVSQFEILEEPETAIVMDISQDPPEIVGEIRKSLNT